MAQYSVITTKDKVINELTFQGKVFQETFKNEMVISKMIIDQVEGDLHLPIDSRPVEIIEKLSFMCDRELRLALADLE